MKKKNEFPKKDTKLEQEFKKAVKTANKLIEEKLKEASNKIEEAVEIAEQYGICFNLNLDCFNNSNGEDSFNDIVESTYIPKTYKKWKDLLDEDENWDLMNMMTGSPNWTEEGWEHSRVC